MTDRRTGLLPITITRLDADHYLVGRITLTRLDDGTWAAIPPARHDDLPNRPLFTAPDLDGILDLAAGAVTMMSPA